MRYELFYLVGSSKEAELEKIREEVKKTVLELGGVFEEKETLERRKTAYPIGKETHGFYVAVRFELENPEKIAELSKKLNLNQSVLRFIVSRADELPELKSREERIRESQNASLRAEKSQVLAEKKIAEREKTETPKKEDVKTEEIKKEEKSPEEKPEKDSVTSDDIDKKLEEILNI